MNRDWLFSLVRAWRKSRCAARRPRLSRVRRLLLETFEDRQLLATVGHVAPHLDLDATETPTSLIVQYRSEATSVSSLTAYLAGTNVDDAWDIAPGIRQVKVTAGVDFDSALAAFRHDANVVFAEPNYAVKLTTVIPTDPLFATEQWALQNIGQTGGLAGADIHATTAWDLTLGDPSVIVAVIDTGVDYDHPDLYTNIWINQSEIPFSRMQNLQDLDGDGLITFKDLNDPQNQGDLKITDLNEDGRIDAADILTPMINVFGQDTGLGGWADGIDNDQNGYTDDLSGYDFVNSDSDPMDDYFHGTHVAGTIAASINNDIGVVGVAPSVRIMPLKFLDSDGAGVTSDAIAALNYAVNNGAAISNNSWGGGGFSQAFETALAHAAQANHIVVAAAGNTSEDTDSAPFYPASYPDANVVSVAATDANDTLANFSSRGKLSVDLGAPGVGIFSTLPTTLTPAMQQRALFTDYGSLSGTSMATPHVAGVLALVRAYNPSWTVEDVINQVLGSVEPVPTLTDVTVTGGRLNAAGALGLIPVDNTPPRVTQSDPSGTATGPVDHIRLTFSEPINADSADLSDIVDFSGPEGPLTPLLIVPVATSNRQLDVLFDPQSTPGNYILVVGPHITDLAGNELDQNGDGLPGFDGDDNYSAEFTLVDSLQVFASTDVPKVISRTNFDVVISLLTVDDDLAIGDLNVNLSLTFARVGNLSLSLMSPAGTLVPLSYRNGGDHANFTDTNFDDQADLAISEGSAPFTGSFRPDGTLASFNGENARGTWQLLMQNVSDVPNRATLQSWSLEIAQGEFAGGGGDENQSPEATDDPLEGIIGTPLAVNASVLLANDRDPDGDPLALTTVGSAVGGTVSLNNGLITFVPIVGSTTQGSFTYVVSDGQATASAKATIIFKPVFPWHNNNNPYDVNNNGNVNLLDAMEVVNQINYYGSSPIEKIGTTAVNSLYYDVVPDNRIILSDAQEVANFLNLQRRRH